MVASQAGFIECARVLLDHNAEINFGTRDDSVKSACLSGNIDMLRFAIELGVTITDSIIIDLFSDYSKYRNRNYPG